MRVRQWRAAPLELLKGPDFHGRLDLHFNVLGPNQRTLAPTDESSPHRRPRDPEDVCFPCAARYSSAPTSGVCRTRDWISILIYWTR